MKKMILIGDSIRLSYQEKVAERLADAVDIKWPVENCRFSAYTLFSLPNWVPDDNYDMIQWNNGQWDTCYMPDGKIHTPLETYLEYQERIACILLKRTKRLIFATTTPVWPEMFTSGHVHPRRNEDIDAYNAAASELLSELGIEILDLNGPVKAGLKAYISEDMVHLTQAGMHLCAERVAAHIGK